MAETAIYSLLEKQQEELRGLAKRLEELDRSNKFLDETFLKVLEEQGKEEKSSEETVDFESLSNKDLYKKIMEELPKRLREEMTLLVQDEIRKGYEERERSNAQKELEALEKEHPDYTKYKDEMIVLSMKNPSWNMKKLYEEAKAWANRGVEAPQQKQSERPGFEFPLTATGAKGKDGALEALEDLKSKGYFKDLF